MSNIQIFNNEQFGEVRTIMEDGQVWFVAKDVCDALNLSNPTVAADRLDDDERTKFNLGRQGETNMVNEFGLYNLVLGSRKEEAKQFKRWITHEVIPSIRKTGSYSIQQNDDVANKQFALESSKMLKDMMDELEIDTHAQLAVIKNIYSESGIDLPLQIPAPTEHKFITMEEIANRVGVYSKSGNPHSQAVGAILEDLNIDESRKTVTTGTNKSHTYAQEQYCESVIGDVKDYLGQLGYPDRIESDSRNKGYNVQYK